MGSRYYEFSLFIESNWIRKINSIKNRGRKGRGERVIKGTSMMTLNKKRLGTRSGLGQYISSISHFTVH